MTVLVTGGAGYIGSHMVLALVDAGQSVVVLDNLSTGFPWLVHPKAHFIKGDCGDEGLVSEIIQEHGIDAVAHFAGSIVVPDSVTDPLGYYFNNTVKSHALIRTAIRNKVSRFIFSSTAAVYGDAKENPIRETSPLNPVSPYGTSKLMTELMLRDTAAAHPMSYVVLRYFNVAGADPQGRSGQSSQRATHLIKVATQAALGERSHLDVFGTAGLDQRIDVGGLHIAGGVGRGVARIVLGLERRLVGEDAGHAHAFDAPAQILGREHRHLAAVGIAARLASHGIGVGDVLGDDPHARLLGLQRRGGHRHRRARGSRFDVRHRSTLP